MFIAYAWLLMVPMCLLYWQNHKCVHKLRSLLVVQQDKVASLEAKAGILIRIFTVCGVVLSVLSMMIYLLQFAQQEKIASFETEAAKLKLLPINLCMMSSFSRSAL